MICIKGMALRNKFKVSFHLFYIHSMQAIQFQKFFDIILGNKKASSIFLLAFKVNMLKVNINYFNSCVKQIYCTLALIC